MNTILGLCFLVTELAMDGVLRDQIGNVLRENPAVIVSVLKNLCAREISKVCLVCKSWRLYGQKIINGRTRMQSHVVVAENSDTFVRETKQYLENLPILPRVALFSHGCMWPWRDVRIILPVLRQSLPLDCNFLLTVVPSVSNAITASNVSQFAYISSSFIFPTLPEGAHLISFHLAHDRFRNEVQFGQLSRAALNDLFGIPDELPVRSLIFFHDVSLFGISNLCTSFWHREAGQIAICGATPDDICSIEPNSNYYQHRYGVFGLAFCGPNVSASSVVIDLSEDAAAKLRLLQEHVNSLQVHPKQMFAFLFAGTRADLQLHCQQFHSLFGEIPLFNINASDYNHGHDYSPARPVPSQPPNWRLTDDSSVFVLVAIT